ncbi:Calcium-transporting ATPase 10, plasma membrane-type [Chytridiales sp. JEL 0842]|nr:Calcium-transporting ATPase 10, plasma membrane-type [Chytridiales sp. JEL 0842]
MIQTANMASAPLPHAPAHLPPLKNAPPGFGNSNPTFDKLRSKMVHMPSDQYGLTPEELGEICSFDKRSSPDQVAKLDLEFGGVEGVAILLRSDIETGLKLKNPDNIAAPKDGKVNNKKVAPTPSEGAGSMSNVAHQAGRDMEASDMALRVQIFGSNKIPPPRSETILEIVWGTIKEDPIIKILLVGAVVIFGLGTAMCPKEGWLEGFVIVIAVGIVLTVTAGNDYAKDKKFKKLLLLQSDKRVRVVRGGHVDEISSWDLVVGDLVELTTGDEVPADGLFVSGNRLIVDESPLTGESIPVKKSKKSPYMFSGCQVSEGGALMLVTGVGSRSSGGQIQELLNEAQGEETVLQLKLKIVAIAIGKVGLTAGFLTFLGLTIRWGIDLANNVWHNTGEGGHSCVGLNSNPALARLQLFVNNFVVGVTVIVVAVPEGLPLAVTISLAFSMFKMIKDQCFVRHLDASETMGEATCICTDKTGTLTENKMTVVKVLMGADKVYNGEGSGEKEFAPFDTNTFTETSKNLISEAICLNSDCFIKPNPDNGLDMFIGSATEGALLVLCRKMDVSYESLRAQVQKVPGGTWPFSSERKRMSTLVQPSSNAPVIGHTGAGKKNFRLYTKGASEIILSCCTHTMDASASTLTPMSPSKREELLSTIKSWAAEGLRTIGIGYKDLDEPILSSTEGCENPETDLIWIGLVGIKDPLRKEVPGAVEQCQKAGLVVRMVTGDNVLTASKIASECHILGKGPDGGIAMEGPVFRALSDKDKRLVIPHLRVLARSSPADKHTLVSILKEMGEVVAVTGDGTNDAPALKEADVGFAMGVAGTQIARNASDIVLLDDNFVSLVSSIRWGRNVLNAVRKFLQFQLAVNLVAIFMTFVGSFTVGESPLNTVQLLWVNLIMDTFGALALASDEPDDDILDHPPHARHANLLSIRMREYILLQFGYQFTVLMMLLLRADQWFPPDAVFHSASEIQAYDGLPSKRCTTMVFLTFVLLQLSNETTARQLNGELNPFATILRNRLYIIIMMVIAVIQVIGILFGSAFLSTSKLDATEWGICVAFAVGNMVYTFIARVILKLVRENLLPPEVHQKKVYPPLPPHLLEPKNLTPSVAPPDKAITAPVHEEIKTSAPLPPMSPSDMPHPNIPSASHAPKPKANVRSKWKTVQSAVVLIGNYQDVRGEGYEKKGPDRDFMESWMRFRKDTTGLPTKSQSLTSLTKSGSKEGLESPSRKGSAGKK